MCCIVLYCPSVSSVVCAWLDISRFVSNGVLGLVNKNRCISSAPVRNLIGLGSYHVCQPSISLCLEQYIAAPTCSPRPFRIGIISQFSHMFDLIAYVWQGISDGAHGKFTFSDCIWKGVPSYLVGRREMQVLSATMISIYLFHF